MNLVPLNDRYSIAEDNIAGIKVGDNGSVIVFFKSELGDFKQILLVGEDAERWLHARSGKRIAA